VACNDERPSPWGQPVGDATIRQVPQDFAVYELPVVAPSGAGEHLMVCLRKRDWSTPAAADALARAFGVGKGRVSYAGMKDRHAVTQQWFTIHMGGGDLPATPQLPDGLEILVLARHHRKLRRGALRGNRFVLRLRGLTAPLPALSRRLVAIAHRGVPNYFGYQRFGRDGDNVQRALAWFRGDYRPRDHHERGILLSAVRSRVFNEVLAARVRDASWETPVAGDRMMLDGRRSLFSGEDATPSALRRRMAAGWIHATGPLPGKAGKLPGQAALPRLERDVVAAHEELIDGLVSAAVAADRRALRAPVRDLAWQPDGNDQLVLGFSLPAGAYATTVLDQLVRVRDAALGNR